MRPQRAVVVLLPLALWAWPAQWPGWRAWTAVALLAFVCTGLAYVLYFRLISRVGPARAISARRRPFPLPQSSRLAISQPRLSDPAGASG